MGPGAVRGAAATWWSHSAEDGRRLLPDCKVDGALNKAPIDYTKVAIERNAVGLENKVGPDNKVGPRNKIGPGYTVGAGNEVGPTINIYIYIYIFIYCLLLLAAQRDSTALEDVVY